MSAPPVLLLVERDPDQRIAEALFQRQIRDGLVTLESGFTVSGAIGRAEFFLLLRTSLSQTVALLLNDWTRGDEVKLQDERASIGRILGRVTHQGWRYAIAVPRLDAWALTDPFIKADFDSNPIPVTDYARCAQRIQELTRTHAFDGSALRATCPDFRNLEEFLERHGH